MKKRIVSLLLVCMLCVGLIPISQAANIDFGQSLPDVFQGNGVYITVTPYTLKNNSEGWKVDTTEVLTTSALLGFVDGYVMVSRIDSIKDDHGYELYKKRLVNYADKNGNLLDLSDMEVPPTQIGAELCFSEGLCMFYNYMAGLYGYMNTAGNVVLEPKYVSAWPFHDGLACVITEEDREADTVSFIDASGKTVLSLPENGAGRFFSNGLLAFQGYLSDDDYFVGYLDKQGKPAITFYRGAKDGYSKDEYFTLEFAQYLYDDFGSDFSDDGYAILADYRGGRRYPAYVVIDTSGKQVGIIDVEPPQYVKAESRVEDGYVRVSIGGNGPLETGWGAVFDIHGNQVRPAQSVSYNRMIDSGVYRCDSGDSIFADMDGNPVIPAFGLGEGASLTASAGSATNFNDGLDLMYCYTTNEWNTELYYHYYLLEAHKGTYTGSGKVYHTATGEMTDGGGSTTQPDSNTPSSWAAEQVNAAVSAGLVPDALQSSYTQATTRAEFCALAVNLYETVQGTEITGRVAFTDTDDVNVQKMGSLGVVSGVGDGKFDPNGSLTREQAATMLSNLAKALGKPLAEQAPTFADNASISSWAADAVGQVQGSGVMSGVGNNTFSPRGSYTREQSIVTILRLYEIVK